MVLLGSHGFSLTPCFSSFSFLAATQTLANHGFINRDGKNVPTTVLEAQLAANFPVVPAFATSAVTGGRNNGLFDMIDDGMGGMTEVLNLIRLHEFGALEHDSSITRIDQIEGDDETGFDVDTGLMDSLLGTEANPNLIVTLDQMKAHQRQRVLDGRRNTVNYGGFGSDEDPTRTAVSTRTLATQAALFMAFGNSDTELQFANRDVVNAIFRDEKFPTKDYDPANFNFQLDTAAEPFVSVIDDLQANINEALMEELPPLCDFFTGALQFLLGLFGITICA